MQRLPRCARCGPLALFAPLSQQSLRYCDVLEAVSVVVAHLLNLAQRNMCETSWCQAVHSAGAHALLCRRRHTHKTEHQANKEISWGTQWRVESWSALRTRARCREESHLLGTQSAVLLCGRIQPNVAKVAMQTPQHARR